MIYDSIRSQSAEQLHADLVAGANPNEVGYRHFTPLMYLCILAKVQKTEYFDWSCHHYSNDQCACFKEEDDAFDLHVFDQMFALLIEYGADVNQVSEGYTALMHTETCHVFQRLLEQGADPFISTTTFLNGKEDSLTHNSAVVEHVSKETDNDDCVPLLIAHFDIRDLVQHLINVGYPVVYIFDRLLWFHASMIPSANLIEVITQLYSMDPQSFFEKGTQFCIFMLFLNELPEMFDELVNVIMCIDRINPEAVFQMMDDFNGNEDAKLAKIKTLLFLF